MPDDIAHTFVLAQRRAVHEFRHNLCVRARKRWSDTASLSIQDVLQWLATTDSSACCAPSGVEIVLEPLHGAVQKVLSGSDASTDVERPSPTERRVMPAPPPLPRAQWSAGVSGPTRSVGTDTDSLPLHANTSDATPASSIDAAAPLQHATSFSCAPHGHDLPTTGVDIEPHAKSAPTTPTDNDLSAVDSLRRRVTALSTENAELDRRCERLKAELAHQMRRSSSPSSLAGSQTAPSSSLAAPQRPSREPRTVSPPPAVGGGGGGRRQAGSSGNSSSSVTKTRIINPAARARTLQALREVRSKLAVVRTGVKALGASDLFHNAATMLQPFLNQHAANARRLQERAEFFERTAQGMQAKLLSLPDCDSPEGYEVQLSADGRSSALFLDAKTWVDFTHAFTSTIDSKFTKVEDFANRGARSLLRSASAEKEMKRSVAELEMRCGELESISVDWECLAVAIASDAVFEAVVVQPCKKLEFAALQKLLSDSNDEVRVVCGVAGWFAKANTRTKATVWRDKRAEAISRVEQLLSQELQHFMMNGAQRNSLRRKVLLLRELNGLLQRLRTDSQPLPAAAAMVASNNALPAGLALASPPAVGSTGVSGSSSSGPAPPGSTSSTGTPTRPTPASRQQQQQQQRELTIAGVRDTADRSRRVGRSGGASGGRQQQLPLVRENSQSDVTSPVAPRSAGSTDSAAVALPAVGSPPPRPGPSGVRGATVGNNGGREV